MKTSSSESVLVTLENKADGNLEFTNFTNSLFPSLLFHKDSNVRFIKSIKNTGYYAFSDESSAVFAGDAGCWVLGAGCW